MSGRDCNAWDCGPRAGPSLPEVSGRRTVRIWQAKARLSDAEVAVDIDHQIVANHLKRVDLEPLQRHRVAGGGR